MAAAEMAAGQCLRALAQRLINSAASAWDNIALRHTRHTRMGVALDRRHVASQGVNVASVAVGRFILSSTSKAQAMALAQTGQRADLQCVERLHTLWARSIYEFGAFSPSLHDPKMLERRFRVVLLPESDASRLPTICFCLAHFCSSFPP